MTAYTRWGTRWSGSYYGLMTGIMRGEWGNMGMSITDNVLTTYTNGVDAVLGGGVTTHDAMLWYVTEQLPKFENDPVVVTAMRNACHHNLYAIANSSVMNGVGAETTVKAVELGLVKTLRIVAIIAVVIHVVMVVMWIRGKIILKQTEEYKAYKAIKKQK
jgi:beta-glucosidase